MAEREIKTVLTLEDASFSKGLKAATSNVSAIRAEMQAAISGANGLGKGMKQWKAQVSGLSQALKGERQQMSLLNRQYTEQKKKLNDAAKAMKDAQKAHGKNSEEARKAANAYAYESTQVDDLRVKMARLSTQMNQDKHVLNESLAKPLKAAGNVAAGFAKAVGVSMLAAGAAFVTLGMKSMQARQQLAADLSASQATFGVWSNFIEQDAKNAWKNLGLSTDAYLQHAVELGEYLQAAGVPLQESASLTSQLMQAAGDLAGTYGTTTQEALDAIEKAAQGSYKTMKRYGISVSDATLNQWALDKGLIIVGQSLSDEEKKAYAVQYILDKTGQAAGGFATRTDTVNSALEKASAAWSNFIDGTGNAESVVEAFSGAAAAVAKEIIQLTPRLTSGIKSLISQFGKALPGMIKDLSPALGELLTGILDTISGNAVEIGKGAGTLIANLGAAIIENIPKILQSAYDLAVGFLNGFQEKFGAYWNETVWPAIQGFFKTTFGIDLPDWGNVKKLLTDAWNGVKNTFAGIFGTIFGVDPPKSWEDVKKTISEWWTSVKDKFGGIVSSMFSLDFPSLSQIKQSITDWWALMSTKVSGIVSTLFGVNFPSWEEIADSWNDFWGNVYDNLPGWVKDILNFFGLGGGGAQSGETALNAAVNSLADEVTRASTTIRNFADAIPVPLEFKRDVGETGRNYSSSEIFGDISEIEWVRTFRDSLSALDDVSEMIGWMQGFVRNPNLDLNDPATAAIYPFLTKHAAELNAITDLSDNENNQKIIQSIIDGMDEYLGNAQPSEAMQGLTDSAHAATDAVSALSDAISEAAQELYTLTTPGGEHAGGAWNIPRNNYIARLHAGEMVLTADQARRYRAQAAAGNTYNDSASIYIDKYNQYSGADADALLAQMQAMQRRRRMGYGLA